MSSAQVNICQYVLNYCAYYLALHYLILTFTFAWFGRKAADKFEVLRK